MYTFRIEDPNVGLGTVLDALHTEGMITDSRNGPVSRFPKPVCLEYPNPRRRILDHPIRAANHFFHLFETLWMFAGLDTVAPLDLYNTGMKQYSDDGVTFAAPYGYRWRKHFGFDQLRTAVEKLIANPQDRRIVIQMWDPQELRKAEGKDFACNQQILLDTRPLLWESPIPPGTDTSVKRYALDMTVTNRSNDLIYGAMGSNLFHFSMLHEYLAYHSGLELGTYYQISKNMHLYLENEVSKRCYERRKEFTAPSVGSDNSLTELGLTLNMPALEYFVNEHKIEGEGAHPYLENVARPVCEAYRMYKFKALTGISTPVEARIEMARAILASCQSEALRDACGEWFQRILRKKG